jgi:Flp pilus assembly protein TadG
MTRFRQQGLTSVEFAIIGMLAMVVLFAAVELGRMVFVLNALDEATRRGARMAAVCPINDPAIAEVTIWNAPGGGADSPVVQGLSTGNVAVEYLDQNGAVIGDPSPGGDFLLIRYVRVRIQNFQHQVVVPLYPFSFTTPEFPTTLPRESLGVPRSGAVQPC